MMDNQLFDSKFVQQVKADLLSMSSRPRLSSARPQLNTSLTYNPSLERLTLTIYDLTGLEVRFLPTAQSSLHSKLGVAYFQTERHHQHHPPPTHPPLTTSTSQGLS